MKKYELISEPNTNLRRVVALIDIPAIGVHKKDRGGMIESEINLSHNGNCWVSGNARVSGNAQVHGNALVYDNAQVSGDAQVHGNALVYGNAQVHGNALVSGNAWVSGDAQVHGNALVSGDAQVHGNALVSGDAQVHGNALVSGNAWVSSPLYIQGSRFALTNCRHGYIQIGCVCHSFKEWEELGVGIAEKNGFTKEQIDEYREYIKLFKKIGK